MQKFLAPVTKKSRLRNPKLRTSYFRFSVSYIFRISESENLPDNYEGGGGVTGGRLVIKPKKKKYKKISNAIG